MPDFSSSKKSMHSIRSAPQTAETHAFHTVTLAMALEARSPTDAERAETGATCCKRREDEWLCGFAAGLHGCPQGEYGVNSPRLNDRTWLERTIGSGLYCGQRKMIGTRRRNVRIGCRLDYAIQRYETSQLSKHVLSLVLRAN